VFYDHFVELCAKKSVSRTKACTDCGVSRTAWHKWEDGAIPNGSTLNMLADYFGVSVSFLLETETAPAETGKRSITNDELMFALWGDNADGITDADLEDVRRYAAFVKERKKATK